MAVAALVAVLLPACDPTVRVEVVVTDPGAAPDASPGDGVCEATSGSGDCTLRAAIEETNAQPSADIVTIAAGVDPTPGGAVEITGSLEIRGGGATLTERLVHSAGELSLADLTIEGVTGATTCGGAVASAGASVTLSRVVVRSSQTSAPAGGGVCAEGAVVLFESSVVSNAVGGPASSGAGVVAGGALVLVRSVVASNSGSTGFGVNQVTSVGSGPVTVLQSSVRAPSGTVGALAAASGPGQITASHVEGGLAVNPSITVTGSIVAGPCVSGGAPTSAGHNLFTSTACPRIGTDLLATGAGVDAAGAPAAWSRALDAIPEGTAGLCPGAFTTDRLGTARPQHGACDIGAVEVTFRARATVPVDVAFFDGTAGPWSVAAINDAGSTAGSVAVIPSLQHRAVRWDAGGTPSYVAPLGSDGLGIGPDGSVVGAWTDAGRREAFLWQAATSTFVDLGTLPGDTSAQGLDVDAGWVVGASTGAGGTRPWAWSAATGVDALPTLGGATGVAVAVNGSGHAVGWATTADGTRRAVRWDLAAGTVTDIGAGASPHQSEAVDIAADGTVIGTVLRPDLGEDCADPGLGIPACPFSRAFTWDPSTGVLTDIEGLLGPVAAAAFGPDGTIIESVHRPSLQCSGCPNFTVQTYLFDPATGLHTRIVGSSFFRAVDANASGVVVGDDITGSQPGAAAPDPSKLTVTLAG